MWTYMCMAIIISLFFYYFLVGMSRHEVSGNYIPGPKGILLVGNAFDFFMTPESLFYYFRHMANKYKDMFELRLGNQRIVLFYHPVHVEALIHNFQHNDKGYLYKFLRPWLHDGLLLSSGQKWHQRRKILTPAFHFKVLSNFHSILVEKSVTLAETLLSEVNCSKTNIYSFLADFTLNSICETAMGTALDEKSSTFSQNYKKAIKELGTHFLYRAKRIWLHPDAFFGMSKIGRAQKKTLAMLSAFRDCVVKQRRQNYNVKDFYIETKAESDDDILVKDKKRMAMLDLLLNAEQEELIDSEGINEEVDTFIFEGHDTTATALQFTFMLLANHPDVQEQIVEEYRKCFGSSNRSPTLNDLSEMKYLEACIKESLRLYPPVHFIERKSDNPLSLSHIQRAPPTKFTILIFDLHRRSDQFIEPLEFRPERFLRDPTWHPFSYLPFSAGQRNCIDVLFILCSAYFAHAQNCPTEMIPYAYTGQKFAMMEMKLATCAVVSKYRLLPVTKPQDLVFTADIMLRTKDPIFVKFEKRYSN